VAAATKIHGVEAPFRVTRLGRRLLVRPIVGHSYDLLNLF
jgi:hypothetical protein